ncbi:hypothetical protein NNC19_02340 [Clostridium sp. SHJSY1]|nr:hypothetical protein [Clostridium sp. SHJSY1]MDS0524499.1 hypothetical protein [Clostridium sp. SHJSY1]
MSNKRKNESDTKTTSDPSSSKYSRKISSNGHAESPYREEEPSNSTNYK